MEKHVKKHSTGSRRDAEAKKSMERFALMREELKRERTVKSELLEALEKLLKHATGYMEIYMLEEREQAKRAIAKAYGETP